MNNEMLDIDQIYPLDFLPDLPDCSLKYYILSKPRVSRRLRYSERFREQILLRPRTYAYMLQSKTIVRAMV